MEKMQPIACSLFGWRIAVNSGSPSCSAVFTAFGERFYMAHRIYSICRAATVPYEGNAALGRLLVFFFCDLRKKHRRT